MPGIPAKYRETFARLKHATDHLHHLIESGEFHALGYLERRKLTARVRRLYNRLVGPVSPALITGALAAAGVLALAGCRPVGEPVVPQVPDFARVDATTIGLGGYDADGDIGYGYLALVDLDGDSDLDLIYTELDIYDGVLITRQNNNGSGMFGAEVSDANGLDGHKPSPEPVWELLPLTFVDIDNDMDMDLVATGTYYSSTPANPDNNNARLFLIENTGSPTEPSFGSPNALVPGAWESGGNLEAAAFVDIDGDGDLDLITANSAGTTSGHSYLYLLPNTSGSRANFTASADDIVAFPYGYDTLEYTALQGLAVTDLDQDGDLDLVLSYYVEYYDPGDLTLRIRVLENQSTEGQIQFASSVENPSGISFPVRQGGAGNGAEEMSLAAGDIDNDGDIDLIVGTYSDNNVPSTEFFYFENQAANE